MEAQQMETISKTEAQTTLIPKTSQPETQGETSLASPTHEFSFTISLHSATTTTPSSPKHHKSPSAIDLTPADDIFFHGHLLPHHFLSHLHASSPRSSTNSHDSNFIVPKPKPAIHSFPQDRPTARAKPKTFSLSGLAKRVKGTETKDKTEKPKKVKFDVTQFLKRYLNMVKPLLNPRGGKGDRFQSREHHQSCSFSGSLSPRMNKREVRRKRGELSAPASMRNSPTDSGRLIAATTTTSGACSPVSESTMEELQAAIQAAIAHCKKSTASVQETSLGLSLPVTVN